MTADKCAEAVSSAARLCGSAITADWGVPLGAAMRAHERSVDKESTLRQLLGDLRKEVDASCPGSVSKPSRAVHTFMYSDRSLSTPVLFEPVVEVEAEKSSVVRVDNDDLAAP